MFKTFFIRVLGCQALITKQPIDLWSSNRIRHRLEDQSLISKTRFVAVF